MKRIPVKMNYTVEQLVKGETYLLPTEQAEKLVAQGAASKPGEAKETKPAGPSEVKPAAGPTQVKQPVTEASITQPKKNA
jgi:hypothetical protein